MNWLHIRGFFIFKKSFKLKQSVLFRWIGCLLTFFTILSCTVEENHGTSETNNTFISFDGLKLRSGSTHQGNSDDYIVETFRILAFNGGGECVSNTRYSAILNEVIQHPIDLGTYNFVFLANEPNIPSLTLKLDNLFSYNELNDVAYPESAFASDEIIPMIQEIKNVEILSGGGAKIDGVAVSTPIPLKLDRIGARIDVTLKAVEDLDAIFTGVTFSNMPDKVPLTANYNGTINRNVTRTFTLAGDNEYFSDTTVAESGIVWAKNIARIIVPANEFSPVSNKGDATVFTVNMDGKYNPYCELKIATGDYSLPRNTKLDLIATVKMPLEVNIKASPWEESNNNWTPDSRILNVSQIEAAITDFNGVRISFSSNMPKVRVLPVVYVGDVGATTDVTNTVFNDLAITDGTNSTSRFSYDPATGSGYMDVLVDGINAIGNYTYRLILSAEDENGNNQLQREIKVKIAQYGQRYEYLPWERLHVGVFFRNSEKGERIISGQHNSEFAWEAWVDSGSDFITLSSTPSFDPGIGTDNPGDPELFPVIVNQYKNENGTSVSGKGRIYLRVGAKGANTGMPRYGVIKIRYQLSNDGWWDTNTIYVRQGEEPDYVWGPQDPITAGVLSGQPRTAARKFSPYNITAPALKNGGTGKFYQLSLKGGVFVDYPTQGGAHFQWGIATDAAASIFNNFIRRAYNPAAVLDPDTEWSDTYFNSSPVWDPPTGTAYKDVCEVCPGSYYRPSDGPTNAKAFNGPYPAITNSPDPPKDGSLEIESSNFRVSLLELPERGNGYSETGVDRTYPYTGVIEGSTSLGYYSDGFFDRRPIKDLANLKAVSTGNANVAYIGLLFFNPNTNASLFFPLAGRRSNENGGLLDANSSGYYWSSSSAPWYKNTNYGVWGFETNYWDLKSISYLATHGFSMRCAID